MIRVTCPPARVIEDSIAESSSGNHPVQAYCVNCFESAGKLQVDWEAPFMVSKRARRVSLSISVGAAVKSRWEGSIGVAAMMGVVGG